MSVCLPSLTQTSSWACRPLVSSLCLSPTLLLLTANFPSTSLSANSERDVAMQRLLVPKGGVLRLLTTLCSPETRQILSAPPNQEPAALWPSRSTSIRPSSPVPCVFAGNLQHHGAKAILLQWLGIGRKEKHHLDQVDNSPGPSAKDQHRGICPATHTFAGKRHFILLIIITFI